MSVTCFASLGIARDGPTRKAARDPPPSGTSSVKYGFQPGIASRAGVKERQKPIMRKNIRSKAVAFAGLIAVSLLASACNTVAGAGKDTSDLGQDVTHAANNSK
jgi:predicted small secreted protein